MKHYLLLLFFSLTVFSQKTTETFDSKKLGTIREISIGLPPSYETNKTKQYPVLIILDGEYLFDPFFGNLNYAAYWDDLPEMIIVGINQNKNNERVDDSTYDEFQNVPSGKGSQFFEFVGGELLPYIEKKYRTAPFRIIAGNDTTAGFLNFYLFKDNPVFDAYISLSPELAPEMETRIPEMLSKIKKPIFYYQATGDGDLKEVIDQANKMDANIKQLQIPTLNYKYDQFKNSTHYAAALQAIPSALYQFFSTYQPISMAEFTDKIAVLPNGYTKYLTDRYDAINNTLGTKVQIRFTDFKAIEAAILKNKDYNDFDELAQVANKNYPKTMLGDYYLGLMFEKKGDPKKAARYYQSAGQLEEVGDLTKDSLYEDFEAMQSLTKK